MLAAVIFAVLEFGCVVYQDGSTCSFIALACALLSACCSICVGAIYAPLPDENSDARDEDAGDEKAFDDDPHDDDYDADSVAATLLSTPCRGPENCRTQGILPDTFHGPEFGRPSVGLWYSRAHRVSRMRQHIFPNCKFQ